MKIGYVLRSLEDSGVTVYVLRLAAAMRQRGHDVFLVSDGGHYLAEVQRLGLRHHMLPLCRGPFRSYLAARQLAGVVAPEKPDILHGNWRRAQLACHMAERKLGVPFVSTLHLVGIPHGLLHRQLSYWGRFVIVPCSEGIGFLRANFGVEDERIRLIHHGADPQAWPQTTEESRRQARAELKLPQEATVAVCVARLELIKDHQTLLQAVQQVVAGHDSFRLLLIGAGEVESALRRTVIEMGLIDHVDFLGWRDPRPALAAADVFVLTSRHESFGQAPVEAMLTGLAVIRTATEGAADQVQPGVTGEIVPVGDVGAVAQALSSVAEHGEEWRRRGVAARKDALARFTLEKMTEQVEAVYRQTIDSAGADAGRRMGS